MKCLILAAGYATRLYPLTENFPKPLLKVGEKAIIDWLVDDIRSCGNVSGFIVVTNSRFAGSFRDWASDKPDVTVLDDGTSSNETRLGAVRDILFAVNAVSVDEDLLVVAGDNVLDFSLCRFLDYSIAKGSSCIMRYCEPDAARLRKSGVVTVGADDRVMRMVEKPEQPESNWCCPPFYYYIRDDVRMLESAIAEGCASDAPGSFAAWVASKSRLFAMEMPGRRYDIGNLESYRKVLAEYKGIL